MEDNTRKNIYISLIYYPIYCLGPSQRVGIWLQGCNRRCPGCISEHTWKFLPEKQKRIDDLILDLYQIKFDRRVTISGGEPFAQPEALLELLKGLRKSGFYDILVYTGYKYNEIHRQYSDIIEYIDVIVDGQFEQGNHTDFIWKGSENQNMIILTPDKDLVNIYQKFEKSQKNKKELQIIEKEEKIYILGIPHPKDVDQIKNIKNGVVK